MWQGINTLKNCLTFYLNDTLSNCSAPSTTVVFALLSSSFCHTWMVCFIIMNYSIGTGMSATVNLMLLCHGLLLLRGSTSCAASR